MIDWKDTPIDLKYEPRVKEGSNERLKEKLKEKWLKPVLINCRAGDHIELEDGLEVIVSTRLWSKDGEFMVLTVFVKGLMD